MKKLSTGDVIDIAVQAVWLILKCSAPMLISSLVVGLIISIFQTVTQIQESTLTIVPKIIAGVIALIMLMPWMMNLVIQTTNEFFDMIPGLIK